MPIVVAVTFTLVDPFAALMPFALVGTVLGACLTRRMADAWVSRTGQVSLFAVSFKVLVDAVR